MCSQIGRDFPYGPRPCALTRTIAALGLDQTSWPKLEPGATKPWQMWCITAPGVVCHRIKDDKGAVTFKELVGSYAGVIICDALKTHEAGARDGPGIELAGCWAHVYRKFEEAEPDHPEAHLAAAPYYARLPESRR